LVLRTIPLELSGPPMVECFKNIQQKTEIALLYYFIYL
jgi:hypothetical protein